MQPFVNIDELEGLAMKTMNANAFQYYRSGAVDELTLKENVKRADAFKRIKLHPRVLRDVSKISLETTVLGHKVSMPIGIAPTAMQKLCCPEGENVPAAVGYEFQIPYTLSSLSTTSMHEVAKSNQNGLKFMQLYIQKNRELARTLVESAVKNGFNALVLTVDAPVLGKREADERQKFVLPAGLNIQIFHDIAQQANANVEKVQSSEGSGLLKFFAQELDQSLQWNDIKWLKSITSLPIILKGIQSWEDAQLAKEYDVAGVWVSNHGGRQLDTVRAAVDILPEVVHVLAGSNIEIYVDGGIRRGNDIFKCLALGAKCVFVGRPVLYSAAIGGKQGVERMLNILKTELTQTMQLTGTTAIEQINRSYLVGHTIPKPNL